MKKLLFYALILSATIWGGSCSHKTVEKQQVVAEVFDKEKFYNQIGTVPFYISKAYRVVGKDTTDVLADSIMVLYRDAVYPTFWPGNGSGQLGYVQFYSGRAWTNAPVPATAKAF